MDSYPLPPPIPGKKKKPIWPYLVGAAGFLTLLIALAVIGSSTFKRIKQQSEAREVALRDMEKASAEERNKMADSIEKGEMNAGQGSLSRLQNELEKTSAHMSRDDAAATRAVSAYLGKMQELAGTYQKAAERITQGDVLSYKFADRAALGEHRKAVVEFTAANEQLTDLVRRSEEILRAELAAAKIPESTVNATMGGFMKARQHRQVQLRIREYDRLLGESSLAILDMLEKNWGQWSRSDDGQLTFQSDAALATFNEHVAKIQSAAEGQAKAQQQLAEQMRAMGKP